MFHGPRPLCWWAASGPPHQSWSSLWQQTCPFPICWNHCNMGPIHRPWCLTLWSNDALSSWTLCSSTAPRMTSSWLWQCGCENLRNRSESSPEPFRTVPGHKHSSKLQDFWERHNRRNCPKCLNWHVTCPEPHRVGSTVGEVASNGPSLIGMTEATVGQQGRANGTVQVYFCKKRICSLLKAFCERVHERSQTLVAPSRVHTHQILSTFIKSF